VKHLGVWKDYILAHDLGYLLTKQNRLEKRSLYQEYQRIEKDDKEEENLKGIFPNFMND